MRLLFASNAKDRSAYQELPPVDDSHWRPTASQDFESNGAATFQVTDSKSLRSASPSYSSRQLRRLQGFAILAVLGAAVPVVLHSHWYQNSFESPTVPTAVDHHATLPTLLNVVNLPSTTPPLIVNGAQRPPPVYVYSLDNPLYDRLAAGTTLLERHWDQDDGLLERPVLSMDRTSIAFFEPLLLSWTDGVRRDATRPNRWLREAPRVPSHRDQPDATTAPIVTNDTLLVLSCANHGDDPKDWRSHMFDMATVAQARATSHYHWVQADANGGGLDRHVRPTESSWFIPRFPAIRRDYCQFRMVEPVSTGSNHQEQWTLLAESPRITIRSLQTPHYLHVALTHDPSRMVVRFVAGMSQSCHAEVPVVEYRREGAPAAQRRRGQSQTYAAQDMCQAPANETGLGKFIDPGCLHGVVLDGLERNTKYSYRVGVEKDGVTEHSAWYEFTSAPMVSAGRTKNDDPPMFQPFAFLAYGDQGCPATGWTVGGEWIARMVERELLPITTYTARPPVRMVHHIGDLSYAQGAAHIWDEWQHMIEPITRQVPYMVGVGNHEYDHMFGGTGKDPSNIESDSGFHPEWGNFGNDSGGECGVPTAMRFTMPKSEASNGVFWYSYDYANVHFVMISSEHDLQRGSVQHEWLENDLRTVDRSKTPWVIVETHRPLYNPETLWEQNAVGIGMRYAMEDLLKHYSVDIVLAGHYHSYHRSCDGLYRDKCDNGGPTHLTIGSAGARLDEADLYPNSWTAHYIQHQYGYSRITVMNATALHFEFVRVVDGNSGKMNDIGDEFWVHRKR